MKKVAIIITLAVVLTTLSCAGGNTPEAVAKSFLVKLNDLDFNGAALLTTEAGAENVKMLESLMGMTPPEELEKQKEAAKAKPVKIVSAKTTGDSSLVTYQLGTSAVQTLNMKKTNGRWLVDFTKGE